MIPYSDEELIDDLRNCIEVFGIKGMRPEDLDGVGYGGIYVVYKGELSNPNDVLYVDWSNNIAKNLRTNQILRALKAKYGAGNIGVKWVDTEYRIEGAIFLISTLNPPYNA